MIKILAPGFFVTLVLGLAAWFLSTQYDVADALVVALLLGMSVRAIASRHPSFFLVIAYAKDIQRFLIPLGVLLYAGTINIRGSLELGSGIYVRTLASAAGLFAITYSVALLLGCSKKTTLLTAIGTAICGASAIAITSNVIEAEDDDTSNSLIAVTVAGLVAVALLHLWLGHLSEGQHALFAELSGATLQQTGMVKIATASLSPHLRDLALSVKVVRIALIPFIALGLSLASIRKSGGGRERFYVLAMLLGFIIVLALTASSPSFAASVKTLAVKNAATIVFAIGFANLGLLVDFGRLRPKTIAASLAGWLIVAPLHWLLL